MVTGRSSLPGQPPFLSGLSLCRPWWGSLPGWGDGAQPRASLGQSTLSACRGLFSEAPRAWCLLPAASFCTSQYFLRQVHAPAPSPGLSRHPPAVTWACSHFAHEDFDVDCYAQRRLSGGSHSYSGESPRLSPCSSIGKLSKSDEQLSSLDRDSGQCSRNTSCETLGEPQACTSPPPASRLPVAPVRSTARPVTGSVDLKSIRI